MTILIQETGRRNELLCGCDRVNQLLLRKQFKNLSLIRLRVTANLSILAISVWAAILRLTKCRNRYIGQGKAPNAPTNTTFWKFWFIFYNQTQFNSSHITMKKSLANSERRWTAPVTLIWPKLGVALGVFLSAAIGHRPRNYLGCCSCCCCCPCASPFGSFPR